jgi:pimeloyl-ACP methyl ester carboxylesterase
MRAVHVQPPTELGTRDGLAYALFLPERPARGGVVTIHGAGSCKENHFDFARAVSAAGMASVAFDQRGHGASEGALGAGAIDDVATIAQLLPPGPVALRGSSMGGWLALVAGAALRAAAVVAICPASGELLARGVRGGDFAFAADSGAVLGMLASSDERAAATQLGERLLLLHAEGDERVPIGVSQALAAAAPGARFVAVPGGHHQSIQHDGELQSLAVRFIARALSRDGATS